MICSRASWTIFSIIGLINIVCLGFLCNDIDNMTKHNALLSTYSINNNCIVIDKVYGYYNILVNSTHYKLYDLEVLNNNTIITCYTSPYSDITYRNIILEHNNATLVYLQVFSFILLFICGAIIKCCNNHYITLKNKPIFNSLVAVKVSNTFKNKKLIYNNYNSISRSRTNSIQIDNDNITEKTSLLNTDSISIISNISTESVIPECMICYNEMRVYVKVCKYNHYYCRCCIIKIDKDFCIMCQNNINMDDVLIFTQ
jgi:hypothetical protein